MVGVDFFKGPKKPVDTMINGVPGITYRQLGMESFTYYNNAVSYTHLDVYKRQCLHGLLLTSLMAIETSLLQKVLL